jgi:hypothetical protein
MDVLVLGKENLDALRKYAQIYQEKGDDELWDFCWKRPGYGLMRPIQKPE